MPSLSRLERGTGYSLLAGFVLFTASLVLGAMIMPQGTKAIDAKVIASALAWVLLAAVSALRIFGRLRGRRVVWVTVLVFVVVLLQFALVAHSLAGS
jgi:ABC-type uncharacterized transport system permease subunit